MKKILILSLAALLMAAAVAVAGSAPKTYQATGTVLEVRDGLVVLDKGKEGKWEISLGDVNPASVQVGAKVTITYKMVAATVEVKEAPKGAAKPEAKPKTK